MENDYVTKQDLRDAPDETLTRFSQHILHEVGRRFDEVNKKLESIDAQLKPEAGPIQSGAQAMVRFEGFAKNSGEMGQMKRLRNQSSQMTRLRYRERRAAAIDARKRGAQTRKQRSLSY